MKPEEVHKLGLQTVAQLSAEADSIMRSQGLNKGTVGERYRQMYEDPKFRYPNTDAGKEHLESNRGTVEALFAQFGRVGERMDRVRRAMQAEETGEVSTETGGRPAKLFRFRGDVLVERIAAGTKLPLHRSE